MVISDTRSALVMNQLFVHVSAVMVIRIFTRRKHFSRRHGIASRMISPAWLATALNLRDCSVTVDTPRSMRLENFGMGFTNLIERCDWVTNNATILLAEFAGNLPPHLRRRFLRRRGKLRDATILLALLRCTFGRRCPAELATLIEFQRISCVD